MKNSSPTVVKIFHAKYTKKKTQRTQNNDLRELGLFVEQQVPVPLIYKEVKSVGAIAPVHFAQTLTYLKLSGLKPGLLINFNTVILKDGIQRIVNKL